MRSISILFVVICICNDIVARDVTLDQQWKLWKNIHKKHYVDVEEHHRRLIWQENLKIIEEHNRLANLGVHTYWLGINQFTDLTNQEFVQMLKTKTQEQYHQKYQTLTLDANVDLPDTVDWHAKGDVTPVKDQGECASGMIFAVVGSIESAHGIKTNKLISLSENQIADCSTNDSTSCFGVPMDVVLQYIEHADGLEREEDYPYDGFSGKCRFNASKVAVKVCGFNFTESKNETALQQAVATVGPVAALIDISHTSIQLYKHGIYNEPRCSQVQLDGGVLVVGYGNDSGQDYWLAKNSWGTSWGDQGYIKMTRNKRNQCGIATMASYPILC